MILKILLGATTIVSLWYALSCRRELIKWSRQCNYARIAISYKRKVKYQAPITEFVKMVNMLDEDDKSSGRVIYLMGGTAVAIAKAVVPESSRKQAIRKFFTRNKKPAAHVGKRVRTGTWTAKDETPRENRIPVNASK